MALFGGKGSKGKTSDITSIDEILGFFDEIFNKRIPLMVYLKGKVLSTSVYYVDGKKKNLQISNDQILEKFKNTKRKLSLPI